MIMNQVREIKSIPLRLISKSELMGMLSWSEASIDRKVREDANFPQPVRLGPGTIRWRQDEVEKFIRRLPPAHEYWEDQ